MGIQQGKELAQNLIHTVSINTVNAILRLTFQATSSVIHSYHNHLFLFAWNNG